MTAFILSDVVMNNTADFEIYRARASRAIEQYGGEYLIRRGGIEVLEGDWRPQAIVMIKFKSMDHAKVWYASPEYALALSVKDRALRRNLLLLEGIHE